MIIFRDSVEFYKRKNFKVNNKTCEKLKLLQNRMKKKYRYKIFYKYNFTTSIYTILLFTNIVNNNFNFRL